MLRCRQEPIRDRFVCHRTRTFDQSQLGNRNAIVQASKFDASKTRTQKGRKRQRPPVKIKTQERRKRRKKCMKREVLSLNRRSYRIATAANVCARPPTAESGEAPASPLYPGSLVDLRRMCRGPVHPNFELFDDDRVLDDIVRGFWLLNCLLSSLLEALDHRLVLNVFPGLHHLHELVKVDVPALIGIVLLHDRLNLLHRLVLSALHVLLDLPTA